jgi:hypothetical protein
VNDPEEEEEWPEEQVSFSDCTCQHDKSLHGWGACDFPGCPCEGGWYE